MKKKLISLLCLLLVFSMVSACAPAADYDGGAVGDAATEQPDSGAPDALPETPSAADGESRWGEPITVSVSIWEGSLSFGTEPCALYSYIIERFGLKFDPIDIDWGNMYELPLLWAAADNLPDIVGGFDLGRATMIDWADAGLIRSLPSDLSRWPTLESWMNTAFLAQHTYNEQNWLLPRPDTLEPMMEITSLARGIVNRRDWREQLGIPVPETMDDLMDMWQAFSDNSADLPGAADTVFGVLPALPTFILDGSITGYGSTVASWSRLPNGDMIIPAFEEPASKLLFFWREAFNRGIMDPDFITNVGFMDMQAFAQGRAGTVLRQVVPIHLNNIHNHWLEFQPGIDFASAIEILQSPEVPGTTPVYLSGAGFWSSTVFSDRLSDEVLERVLYFFDWAFSEEGTFTLMFGFEGQDWEMVDGEVRMLTDINPDTDMHFNARDLYTFAGGGMFDLANWPGDVVQWFTPVIPQAVREMAWENRNRVIVPGREYTWRHAQVGAFLVPEVLEMGLPSAVDEWISVLTDTSATTDAELWQQLQNRINAAGYERAKDLMTAAVAELLD
ncbi:MAG: hypothetical protein FWC20_03910 [Oscillospiraceae bacterium]|nr:hypothetical protein [Oscillospiraceae bacterium]MCL2278536.1 hypothetical protein [Oscillospiraceae bacterium]